MTEAKTQGRDAKVDSIPSIEAEAPPPFEPDKKRGRPLGSKTRSKDADLKAELRSVEAAWQGVWMVLRFGGRLLGFECDTPMLPDAEAQADAKSLQAVVQRHPRAMQILAWVGAPVVMLQRIAQHFRRKKSDEKADKKPGGTPHAQPVG